MLAQSTAPATSRYGWVVMAALWTLDGSVTIMIFIIGIVLPDLREEMGIRPVQAGLLGSAFFIAMTLLSLPAAIWLSRFSPKRVTLLATFGMAGMAFAQGLAPSYWIFMAARLGFMFLAVSRIQAEVLLIQQWFSGTRIATLNSITVGSFGIGQIVAIGGIPLLLPLLGGWRGVHIALAGVYLVVAIAWLVVGREREYQRNAESPPQNGSSPLGALRRHPVLFLLASTQIGGAIAWASFLTFFPTYGVEVHGLTLVAVGSLFVVFPIGGVIGAFSAGYLSNLARRRKPFIFIPGFLMPVLYLGVLTVSPSGWIPLLIALGFTSSMIVPIVLTFPYDLGLSPREVTVAVGLVRTITPLGATLGPILTGVLQETTGSLELALTIILPVSVTVGIIGLFLPETSPLRRRRREAVT